MRSINGYSWQNAYAPLTKNEQESVYDGVSIRLREPNGCWEAQFFFITYTDPVIQRSIEIPILQIAIFMFARWCQENFFNPSW
ncbi:MAG: hypothetical protein LBG96_10180 [Tannerella sp.]|jgi:PhoPQ-activated pathogenicity-related protein|nr:hypothetical protein [Tannerella sp.]